MKTEKLEEFINEQIAHVVKMNDECKNAEENLDKLIIKERQLGMLSVITSLQRLIINS